MANTMNDGSKLALSSMLAVATVGLVYLHKKRPPPVEPEEPVTLVLYVHEVSNTGPVIVGARVTGSDANGSTFDKLTNSSGYVVITGAPGVWSFSISMLGYETRSWSQSIIATGTGHTFLELVELPPEPPPELVGATFVQITGSLISDVASADVISQAAAEINMFSPAPAFVIHTGDIVDNPSDALFRYYKDRIIDFTCPVLSVIGDHDADAQKITYESYLGPRNYAFNTPPYHCIVLDSTKPDSLLTYGGGFEEETLTWLQNHLSTLSPTTPIIVFTHHSFWSPLQYNPKENLLCDVENPDEIMSLFAGYNLAAIFTGHAYINMEYSHPSTGAKFVHTGALSVAVSNTDYSPPGYRIAEFSNGTIKTYWVPLGKLNEYYIWHKQDAAHIVTVAQDGSGDYNGTTEVPIQQAINYLESIGGGTVIIKPGTYIIGDTYPGVPKGIMLSHNIWLIGTDRDTVILKFSDGTLTKKIGFKYYGLNNIRIEDLTIDGNKQNRNTVTAPQPTHVDYCGIELEGAWSKAGPPANERMTKDIVVDNCRIINILYRGFVSYAGRRIYVGNCIFENCGSGAEFDHWVDYAVAENNIVRNCGGGSELNDTSYVILFRNQFLNIRGYGVYSWEDCNPDMRGNAVVYNYIRDQTDTVWPLHLDRGEDGKEIIGNVIENAAYGIKLRPNVDNVMADNKFINVGQLWEYNNSVRPPDGIEFVTIGTDLITVRVLGVAIEFLFEVKEYTETGPVVISSGWITTREYTFPRNAQHPYGVRARIKTSYMGTYICPYTLWHFTHLAEKKIKVLYLWSFYNTIFNSPSEQERFFEIAEKEKVNNISIGLDSASFKFFDNYPGYPQNAYQTFITEASSLGMKVHAGLGGGPDRVYYPEQDQPYIEAVLKYNRENPSCRFAGIDWDIEQVSDYSAYADYLRTIKTYSYNGETIVTQNLTLTAYTHTEDTPKWREWLREIDIFYINTYADTLDKVIEYAGRGPDICEEEGIRFLIGLETDELYSHQQMYTLFEEGKERYHELEAEINTYFSNYPQFAGQYVSQYQRAIQTWYKITSVSWPSGEFQPGEIVSVPLTLRTSGGYSKKARGVELQLRDEEGKIWKTSKIVVLPTTGTVETTLEWIVPEIAIVGSYDAKVTVYDLDWRGGGYRDPLYYVYGDFVAGYSLPPLEELTLEEYINLVTNNPGIFYGHGREYPIALDYKGWEEDLFMVR